MAVALLVTGDIYHARERKPERNAMSPQKPFAESGTSPPLRITLSRIDLVPGCTIGTGVGLDAEGNEVTFSAGWRPLLQITETLEAGHHVEVWLDGSQIVCWDSGRRWA